MNYSSLRYHLSALVLISSLSLLPPLLLAWWDSDFREFFSFAATFISAVILSLCIRFRSSNHDDFLGRREAILVVILSWMILCVESSVPFLLAGVTADMSSAFFEATSGLTTTGATILSDVESLSRSINLWRCLMHWLGGMGIVILFVAVFPQLGVGAKFLFENESAGPASESPMTKIKKSALSLWWLYTTLTFLCATALRLSGMDWFDAICHSFSTLGTGGFSTKNNSIAFFENPLAEWIIILFMFLAALNFGLLLSIIRGNPKNLLRNAEAKVFIGLNLLLAIGLAICHFDMSNPFESLRSGLFQTLAVSTSTGFMTQDFDSYPNIFRFIILIYMFIGGCAGSTAGGLKVIRITSLISLLRREVHLASRPKDVLPLRLGGRVVSAPMIIDILLYICVFGLIVLIASGLLVSAGYSSESAFSAALACISSIGPGLNEFGPTQNFGHAPPWIKTILSFCMIAGRLEILILFAPFTRSFWRR